MQKEHPHPLALILCGNHPLHRIPLLKPVEISILQGMTILFIQLHLLRHFRQFLFFQIQKIKFIT